MMNRIRKFFVKCFGREYELRERLFRFLLFVGSCVGVASIVESGVLSNDVAYIVPLVVFMILLIGALFYMMRSVKVKRVSVVIAILLQLVILPFIFFTNGAIDGGASVWLVVPFIYVFLLFSGKMLVAFSVLFTLSDVILYMIAYAKPHMILHFESRSGAFWDSLFSVIVVGLGVGFILHFQVEIFETERAVAVAQKEEIEKLSNSKEKFFASMSHELRTPINSIVGLNEMILRNADNPEVKEYAEDIRQVSRMLLNLVNDVLDFSQIEMKQMEIIENPYDTQEMFQEVVDMMSVRMQEKGLTFQVEIDDKLPRKLIGDKKRLQQILLNILTNAVKYTKEGSVTLIAYGEEIVENEMKLTFSVSDTGIGIKKEDLEFLYDIFKRVGNASSSQIEGSGLGLSITKQLVSLMGGEIKVDSIYTKGSTFSVMLTQKVEDATPIGNATIVTKEEHQKYVPSFQAMEARVLIVDDSLVNIKVLSRMLEQTKVQIDTALSGEQCLEMTREKTYNVILLDNRMPGISGAETCVAIRTQENGLCKNAEILLCTAESIVETEKIVEEYRFNGYVEKPIIGKRLEQTLLKHLPEELIEQCQEDSGPVEKRSKLFRKKKKRLCITTDCICDIPEEILEQYDVRVMYLYIKTAFGRYADNKEIDVESLKQYLAEQNARVAADSATVEEFEEFFADMLTEAEEIVHISMAKNSGVTYSRAVAAAQGFDHVQVVDAGYISCGQGLLVMSAAQYLSQGVSKEQLLAYIEEKKTKIASAYIMENTKVFYEHGYTNAFVMNLFERFHMHPALAMHQSCLKIVFMYRGKMERAWKDFIRKNVGRRRRINNEVLILTHAGCTAAQLELIKYEIQKYVQFKHIIVQKASVSTACNGGLYSIAVGFYTL